MNKRILEELERQFPKGDKARGKALVLHAIAQIELEDLQKAHNIAVKEFIKALKKLRTVKDNKIILITEEKLDELAGEGLI